MKVHKRNYRINGRDVIGKSAECKVHNKVFHWRGSYCWENVTCAKCKKKRPKNTQARIKSK